ncbi:MAG: sigma-70 family RNA polymerase sigma factor [Planctomycetota bacterium]
MSSEFSNLDSEQLLAKVCERIPEALAEWMRRENASLAQFIRSISGDRLLQTVEVDDLLQEICTAALTGLPTAPFDEYSPTQWLQHLARRRVVDAHRFHFEAKRRDVRRNVSIAGGKTDSSNDGLEGLLAASFTSASAAFSQDIRLRRLQEAIEQLSEEARSAVRLRYDQGMSSKEIAERLGKSDTAVRVLLSRSLRQLEKTLMDVRPTR